MTERGTLLVVGSNPPSKTSGQRTLARVNQAATILGFDHAVIANIFALPTYRSGGIAVSRASENCPVADMRSAR